MENIKGVPKAFTVFSSARELSEWGRTYVSGPSQIYAKHYMPAVLKMYHFSYFFFTPDCIGYSKDMALRFMEDKQCPQDCTGDVTARWHDVPGPTVQLRASRVSPCPRKCCHHLKAWCWSSWWCEWGSLCLQFSVPVPTLMASCLPGWNPVSLPSCQCYLYHYLHQQPASQRSQSSIGIWNSCMVNFLLLFSWKRGVNELESICF